VLHAITEEGSIHMINSSTMGKLIRKGQTLMAHLFMVSMDTTTEQETIEEPIKVVLQQFEDVFAEPKGLPPVRSLDHSILLKLGSLPVSLRPYKYNYYKKEELEKQVKDMLSQGTIQPVSRFFRHLHC